MSQMAGKNLQGHVVRRHIFLTETLQHTSVRFASSRTRLGETNVCARIAYDLSLQILKKAQFVPFEPP
jgi:hypothetical protein